MYNNTMTLEIQKKHIKFVDIIIVKVLRYFRYIGNDTKEDLKCEALLELCNIYKRAEKAGLPVTKNYIYKSLYNWLKRKFIELTSIVMLPEPIAQKISKLDSSELLSEKALRAALTEDGTGSDVDNLIIKGIWQLFAEQDDDELVTPDEIEAISCPQDDVVFMNEFFESLTPRTQKMLIHKADHSAEETGKVFGITKQQVCHITRRVKKDFEK